ncbi:MAG TPA: FkbM family methyltransferase, partial [Phycisphaerales bacterium]|nr:FkbM family methyltransferase [Phycisphaerales bacterium]
MSASRVKWVVIAALIAGLIGVRPVVESAGAEPGAVVVPTINYNSENNFGGLELGKYESGERVPVTTIDRLELPRCHLLKIDVEGMELEVLRGATQTLARLRPLLYLENDRPENSPPLIEFLLNAGYRLYWHTPPLFHPGNFYGNDDNEFPKLVSANMLGVHESIQAQTAGLRRI